MITNQKESTVDVLKYFETNISRNTVTSERSKRNNNYIAEHILERPDIHTQISDIEQITKNLKNKLDHVSHTYRKHIPFFPPYNEDLNGLKNMSMSQIMRVYLITEALEDDEFIHNVGMQIEQDILDTSCEYGGFIIFDDRNIPVLNPVTSAYTDNHSYLMPKGAADKTPHIARYHLHASINDCSENSGPSGGTLIIKTGDMGNCYERTMQFGEDHNILITKLYGRNFNIDFYSGEMLGKKPHINVIDLGNYSY